MGADFLVSEHGKVKITDPANRRIRYFDASGHKAFTLGLHTYFPADLVARAFHPQEKGRWIDFKDGDPWNAHRDNLDISDDDTGDGFDRLIREPSSPAATPGSTRTPTRGQRAALK